MLTRRHFINLAALGSIASISGIQCRREYEEISPGWIFPESLSSICDEKTLLGIGEGYAQVVQTKKLSDLKTLIMDSTSYEPEKNRADSLFVQKVLSDKIQDDFKKNRIVVIKGWVLSETEARQCLFLYLSKS